MITMRIRKTIIWLGLLLLGLPIVFFLLTDISVLMDYGEAIASGLLIMSLMIASWRLKKRLKRRMAEGVGRTVADHELLSMTRWMEIPDQAGKASRDADRFDFSD